MNRKKRILAAIPALTVMAVIFLFSAQHAEQSSAGSDQIVEYIWKLTGQSSEELPQHMNQMTFVVRKLAHTMEYAVLSLCLSYFYYQFEFKKLKFYLCTFVTGVIYACTDEWHQYFVPGRSCELRDVLIDANGVFLGILAVILILRHKKRKEEHKRM